MGNRVRLKDGKRTTYIFTVDRNQIKVVTQGGGGVIEGGFTRGGWMDDMALDVLESVILAHACAGIDILSDEYVEGIEVAYDAIGNAR
jgi:hypothetical protein